MASKAGRRGLSAPQIEHEIERCRELEHWTKVEVLTGFLFVIIDGASVVFRSFELSFNYLSMDYY